MKVSCWGQPLGVQGAERRGTEMNKDKIFKLAKGFRGRANNCITIARRRVEKAMQNMYRDRKNRKREFRELWIQRINAATREHGVRFDPFFPLDPIVQAGTAETT